jgi:hypothetical protein
MGKEKSLDVETLIRVNVDQFYGIEIEEFPAQIAQTALWLMDHQMNMLVRERFGQYYGRIPLTASPSIVNGNALATDWESVVPKAELSYILGNPPFLGYSIMSKAQKGEVEQVFDGLKACGMLDYVTCWYKKAAQYIQGTGIAVAFVSTNSITQGEQVPILWPELLNKYGIRLNFAHQTFKWSNEARGKAAVYCVIIGFSLNDWKVKKLYTYADITKNAVESIVNQINAYLIDAPMVFIESRNTPICKVSPMLYGNKPVNDGFFFLNEEEKERILQREPALAYCIRPFIGAFEFINGIKKYCIWLKDLSPELYSNSKEIIGRIESVRKLREASKKEATRKLAEIPALFGEIRQPDTDYLLIPRVSSERRKYIPVGFMSKEVIVGDSCSTVPNATLYEFGVITSTMHMAWTRRVCGRLKSDYRYSGVLVYNNFPWPPPTAKQQAAIEKAAQAALDARQIYPNLSLATLYDPNTMVHELVKAHQKLDKAVEIAYGRTFANDTERVAYLFELYQKFNAELFVDTRKRGKGRKV